MQGQEKELIQDCPHCTELREKAHRFNECYNKLIDFGRNVPNVNELKVECATCNDTGTVLTDYGRKVRTVLLGDVRKLIDQAYKDIGLKEDEDQETDVFEPLT